MVTDALKGYIQLANGLTDVTRDRASAAAKSLAAQSPDMLGSAASTAASTAVSAAAQAQSFAEELLVTSRDNRALLIGIIRTEVERAVAALGFAKESEVDAVRHKVDRLEETIDGLGEETPFATPTLRAALTPVKKVAPTKPAAKKPAVKKAPAKKVVSKKPAVKKAPAKKVVSKKAVPATVVDQEEPDAITPDALATTSVDMTSVGAPDVVDLTRTQAASPVGDGTQA